LERLFKTVQKDSLVTLFGFPPEIKPCCSQYLLYFVQFLEDLGIRAESQINEEAGRVLFTVIPRDGAVALERIREALGIYLRIPHDSNFNNAGGQPFEIAVVQLRANVLFLQSQWALALAMLETKNATIEALNLTIFQQRQFATGPLLAQHAATKDSESEPLVGDTVHLTKYEGKFLKVDLPTILRRLKRSFGVGERKDDDESYFK
jgi:hypothetical protein